MFLFLGVFSNLLQLLLNEYFSFIFCDLLTVLKNLQIKDVQDGD